MNEHEVDRAAMAVRGAVRAERDALAGGPYADDDVHEAEECWRLAAALLIRELLWIDDAAGAA